MTEHQPDPNHPTGIWLEEPAFLSEPRLAANGKSTLPPEWFVDIGDNQVDHTAGRDFSYQVQEEANRLCICDHRLYEHGADGTLVTQGCLWSGGNQICTCAKFERAHLGRRPNCWCYSSPFEREHPAEVFSEEPTVVQRALDAVRDDLILLKMQLDSWADTPDLNSRVENWHFNTWRHMEEILTA
jgi:hypothetical protein